MHTLDGGRIGIAAQALSALQKERLKEPLSMFRGKKTVRTYN